MLRKTALVTSTKETRISCREVTHSFSSEFEQLSGPPLKRYSIPFPSAIFAIQKKCTMGYMENERVMSLTTATKIQVFAVYVYARKNQHKTVIKF